MERPESNRRGLPGELKEAKQREQSIDNFRSDGLQSKTTCRNMFLGRSLSCVACAVAVVIAIVPALCVGVFSRAGSRSTPWSAALLPYFGGRQMDRGIAESRLPEGAAARASHWAAPREQGSKEGRSRWPLFGDLFAERAGFSQSESEPEDITSASASATNTVDLRGGGGRGWWFPGQRARRRRNLARATQRAAVKRGSNLDGLPAGLSNQGNTCYLNSLLQNIYHAPGMREAIMEAADVGSTVSALAKVFRDLDAGARSASTVPLTRAMGVDPRVQQDAQEFGRFLFMALEAEAAEVPTAELGNAGERLSGAINDIFAGRLVNYIECVDVPHSTQRQEVFFDLPLDVKGSKTLTKSLDRFTEAELLTGDNRWRAGEHGLQDARKGVRFVEFPPVLQFHLKRFEYDPFRDDLTKINDRFEFPTEVDLSPWLVSESPASGDSSRQNGAGDAASDMSSKASGDEAAVSQSMHHREPLRYRLSAVVMHVGGPSVGHYYAYVRRPTQGAESGALSKDKTSLGTAPARWVKLDDHRTSEVSEEEVLRDAYGGGRGHQAVGASTAGDTYGLLGQVGRAVGGGTASAYMLQYVREESPESPLRAHRRAEASESEQP